MAEEIIRDPRQAANFLLRRYRDEPDFEFTQEEAGIVHSAYEGRIPFIDNKPVMDEGSTVEFLRSQAADPSFVASEDEFNILRQTDPTFMDRVKAGAEGVADYAGQTLQGAARDVAENFGRPSSLLKAPGTAAETVARVGMDMGTLAAGTSKFIEKAPFMAAGALGLQNDYQSYLAQKTIDQNYASPEMDRAYSERAQGKSVIGLPEGTFMPGMAEVGSFAADPTNIIPFGVGAKAGQVAGKGAIATRAATTAARGVETAARATATPIRAGLEAVERGLESIPKGPAQNVARKATGLVETPFEAAEGAITGVEKTAQAARTIGEEALTGPSQFTVMERVAKNPDNPSWLRQAARLPVIRSQGLQEAVGVGAGAARGAAQGAVVGGGIGLVGSGGEAEGLGGGLTLGGALGAAGGAVGRVSSAGQRKAIAQQADINNLFQNQAKLGLDVERIANYAAKDNRPFLDAATFQRIAPDTQVEFHTRDSFSLPENAGIDAAGAVKAVADKSGRIRMLVNLDDRRATGDTVRHEMIHALMKSPAINKSEGRMAVYEAYGTQGVEARGAEYARKLLMAETDGRRVPTEPEVRAKMDQLRDDALAADPNSGPLGWAADEILAEQFQGEFRGMDLNDLRRRTPPGTNLARLQEGMLAPLGRALSALGVDVNGPKPANIDSLFADNPLTPSPRLRELTARWFRERDRYLDGIAKAETTKEASIVPGPGNRNLASNPAITFTRSGRSGIQENDFAYKFPDGTVRLKNQPDELAGIRAVEAARVKDVQALYDPNKILERGDTTFGKKLRADGVQYIGGPRLPEGFYQLESFNDFHKQLAKEYEAGRDLGRTHSIWYQKIGSGEDGSWATSVKKGLGDLSVSQAEIAPVSWKLTKAGNIQVQAVDITALRGRMLDLRRSGKGRIEELWGGDLDAYQKDLFAYLKNHQQGLPGDAGIGAAKRDAINYLFGFSKGEVNPLVAADGRAPGSLFKSYRLDRIANSRDTGRTGYFIDYGKQAQNLAPATASARSPLTDEEFTATLRKAAGDPQENLRLRLARREGTGVAKNRLTEFTTRDGKPIVIGASTEDGGKPFASWQRETESWLSGDEIARFREWYDELPQIFREKFDEGPGRYMVSWLAGQQNASPAQALGIMFRAMDRIDGIISINEKTGKLLKGGLADDKVEAILQGKTPEGGYGPKLTDFADAGLGRPTRSFTGDDPRGGQPFVADVHTGRDSGHVDQQTLTRLVALSEDGNLFLKGKPASLQVTQWKTVSANGKTTKVPERVIVRQPGEKSYSIFPDMRGSPGANQYEGISVWGNRLADFLNQQNWEGGNWKPAQVQAVGWMRVLRQYGLNEGTAEGAFRANTRDIYAEVNYSSGAVLPRMFPEFQKLTLDQQTAITSSVIEKTVDDLVGIIGGSLRKISVTTGKGYFGGQESPSMMIRAMGSKEVSDMLTVALAYVSEQTMAMSVVNGQGGKSSNGIYIRKADSTPFTPESLNALASLDQVKGFSVFPVDGYDTVFIADAGKDFRPKGFSEEKALTLETILGDWAVAQGIKEIDIEPTPCKIESHGQSYQNDPSGSSFLRVFDARGGGSKIRRLIQYRGQYIKNLREAFAKFAPEQPIRKEDPEVRAKITETQKEILLEADLTRRRIEKALKEEGQ